MSRLPLAAAFATTVLWGVAAVVVAGVDMNLETLIALSCLVQAPIQLVISRRSPVRGHAPIRRLGMIGLGSAGITFTYFASLTLAPPALAAALHLSAPILLVGYAVLRRRRRADRRTVLVVCLLVAGVGGGVAGAGVSHLSLAITAGLGLALISAVLVAVNVTLISRHGGRGNSTLNGAISCLVCSVPFLPALVVHPPTLHEALLVAAVTVCCWVPAGTLNWWATPRLTPALVSTIGLNEAAVTGAVGWAALGAALTPAQLAGGVAIVAAVGMEARSHRGEPRPVDVPAWRRPARGTHPARVYRRVTRPVRTRTLARRLARASA